MLEQRFARLGLDKTISAEKRHDILLVVSELVTNAGCATPHSAISFSAVLEVQGIWVGVWDASDDKPTPRDICLEGVTPDSRALDEGYASEEIGGLGLPLVMALSDEQGIERTRPHGKWVWAKFHFQVAAGQP
ncbi:ATP-binding protein [Actinomadura sp. 9N407]|uniref:ATP-binding protein n=1 Tax=Actinomadura sp. 9N407 TaxID=3375154 RepID=UPI00379BF067